jgi:mannosyltransferase OCH1-like enzyme
MYLHKFGGVYADLDFESIRPMDEYLNGKQLVLGRMSTAPMLWSEHSIPNAFMASAPKHPFWIKVLEYISINHEKNWVAEQLTGPAMLYKLYNRNSHDKSITISDYGIFNFLIFRHFIPLFLD